MAENTQAQKEAVKRYQQNSESWTVRTNDAEKMALLKKAKATGNLSELFFEFLKNNFK